MHVKLLYHVFFRTHVDENNVKLIIPGIAQSNALVNYEQHFLGHERYN